MIMFSILVNLALKLKMSHLLINTVCEISTECTNCIDTYGVFNGHCIKCLSTTIKKLNYNF